MAKLKFNLDSGAFFTVTLVILTLFISFSNSCLPSYVPDSDVQDHIEYPWEKWKMKTRNFESTCQCGDLNGHNSIKSYHSWNSLIRIQYTSSIINHVPSLVKYCTGTLINSHFILTAYSCFLNQNFSSFEAWGPQSYRVQPHDVKVWLNIDDAKHIHPEENPDGLPISEIIHNPVYISSVVMKRTRGHNIVLLRLKDKINFKSPDSPKPVCIYPSFEIKSGTPATIFGWAKPKISNKPSEIQMKQKNVSTVIFDVEECRRGTSTTIDDDSFCTGGKDLVSLEGLEGRALGIVSSSNGTLQVGATSWMGTHMEKNQYGQLESYIFYTMLKPNLPFIFYHSEKANAMWCKEPTANHFSHIKIEEDITVIARPWRSFTSEHRIEQNHPIWEPNCTCGTHDATQGRIVGGVEAIPHEFKWQVLLKILVLNKGKKVRTICGGSIINDRFILTAAHCVVQGEKLEEGEYPGVLPHDITAYIHVHKKSHDKDAKKVGIRSVWYHPDYIAAQLTKRPYFDYDVALLELEIPLAYEPKTIVPICLPTSDKKLDVIGKNAVVSGWGLTDPANDGSISETLQKLDVPIQTLDYCRSIATNRITENFICAGTLTRYKDAAPGDSGGPLSITYDNDNQYVQIGIVSWGEDVANSNTKTAALYSNVQSALDTIDYHSHIAGAKWCPPSATIA